MPLPPARPPALRGRVFRGTGVVARGLLTEDQLRSSAWRRLRHDVYADAELSMDHTLMTRAVALAAPPDAVFGGLTAAMLWGARDLATPEQPVEVVLPPGTRWSPRDGVLVRTAELGADEIMTGRGLRWTGRVRTGTDLIRRGPRDDAVVLLDRLVRAGVVSLIDVREAAARLPRGRGSRLAREVATLADGLAESPRETELRLLVVRAGLPPPVAQFRVFDDDGFVARVDFAWPEQRLALEYDGLWHAEPGQFSRDRTRLNRLTAAGWRVVFVTAADMQRLEQIVQRLEVALHR